MSTRARGAVRAFAFTLLLLLAGTAVVPATAGAWCRYPGKIVVTSIGVLCLNGGDNCSRLDLCKALRPV